MTHIKKKTDKESGFAIYLVIGFIALMTLTLTSMGQRINQQNRLQFAALGDKNMLRAAHQTMQLGLLDMQQAAPALAADEAGWQLPIGANNTAVTGDRQTCLDGRSALTAQNASAFTASADLTLDKIRRRYFIYDANAGGTPRRFDIFGCAIRNGRARVTHGQWRFNPATQDFSLLRLLRY